GALTRQPRAAKPLELLRQGAFDGLASVWKPPLTDQGVDLVQQPCIQGDGNLQLRHGMVIYHTARRAATHRRYELLHKAATCARPVRSAPIETRRICLPSSRLGVR